MSPAKKVPLICQIVSDDYGVDVLKKSDMAINKEARFMAMLLVRKNTFYSFAWICEYFSTSDAHNTINRFERRLEAERGLWMRYERLQQSLIHKVKDSNNARLSDSDLTTTLF